MKSLTLLAFLTIGSTSTFMPAVATDDTTSKHHFHSVHLTKTHHRAKTTSVPHSTLDTPTTMTSDPATAAGPTCTAVPAGSKDTPTIHEPGTSIGLRTECGITDKTVEECPFLCGPGGDGTLKACFPDDVSSLGGSGGHVCKPCLPPCKGEGDKTATSDKTIATPTAPPKPSCTSVAPGSKDSPASKDPGTGLLIRATCGITDETVDQCPYLCSQAGEELSGSASMRIFLDLNRPDNSHPSNVLTAFHLARPRGDSREIEGQHGWKYEEHNGR